MNEPKADTFIPTRPMESMRHVALNPGFRSLVDKVPPTAMSVPSMMSADEKRCLYGLARNYYKGEGIIVDGGIFLGASSRCFADGLRENPNLSKARALKDKPIVSFEKGSTNPGMIPFFERHGVQITASLNDSFLPVVRDYLSPAMDIIDLREGDIMQTSRTLDYPIEICFLDVLKLPDISHYCISTFFPRLIPGRSIVIQQDYFYERLPYIKSDQEYLRDHFTFIGEVGSTALFLCTSAIPEAKIDALKAGIPYEEQLKCAAIAMQRSVDPARRFMMAISKVRLIEKNEGRDAAIAYLKAVKSDYPDQVEDKVHKRLIDTLQAVEKMLKL